MPNLKKTPFSLTYPPSLWPFVRTHIRGLLGIKQSKRKGLKGKREALEEAYIVLCYGLPSVLFTRTLQPSLVPLKAIQLWLVPLQWEPDQDQYRILEVVV